MTMSVIGTCGPARKGFKPKWELSREGDAGLFEIFFGAGGMTSTPVHDRSKQLPPLWSVHGLPPPARFGALLFAFVLALPALVACHPSQPKPSVASEKSSSSSPAATLWTCGMHPEVIQDHPGNCPKCGMKLVPMDPDRARSILAAQGKSAPAPGNRSLAGPAKERKILYWRSSMEPGYVRNAPGKDSMGMDLIPVYEEEVSGGPTIRVDPATEQNMGVRYDTVRQGPLVKTVRTVGTVAYDEQGQGTVTTKVDGWVEKVFVDQTGTQVHRGDPLFEIYAPELVSAQEEFLTALRDAAQGRGQTADELARSRLASSRERLRLFDISDEQIQALEKDRQVRRALTINSRLTGIVTQKNIVQGDSVKAGMPLYQVADLSTVWVIGRVYESDLPAVSLGQEAHMRLDYLPGRLWRGRVTYVYPYLEPGTREISIRMEFHNPGYELKPGMYATIELKSLKDEHAILAPAAAVIDTGERQVAFVAKETGQFEPRRVVTGLRSDDDQLQILSGLSPGERVVVSGQFLLDSESRLREATMKMLSPGPVDTASFLGRAGAAPGSEPTTATATGGTPTTDTLGLQYVCPMPSHAGILYEQPGNCPLCGMKLVPIQPWQMGQSPIDHWTCPMPEHYSIHAPGPGKCPICGMTLIPVTQNELQRYESAPESTRPAPLYTCPMPSHANVVSDHEGNCPICGMKLVPTESVPHGKQAEKAWKEKHETRNLDQMSSGTMPGMTMP